MSIQDRPDVGWGYLEPDELDAMGVTFGEGVQVSRDARLHSPRSLVLGDNVRIDDFTVVIGDVTIGSYVHIHSFCGLYGGDGIVMEDFSGLSSRVAIYTASDDYTGETMTNPTVPEELKAVKRGSVTLGRHVIIGAGTIILPSANCGEGSAVGAMSLVSRPVDPWTIAAGVPAVKVKDRSRKLLEFEAQIRS